MNKTDTINQTKQLNISFSSNDENLTQNSVPDNSNQLEEENNHVEKQGVVISFNYFEEVRRKELLRQIINNTKSF
jgi:hypothetical protein